MRQKRAKAYRKLMELYSRAFGFRQPYQVLVDAEMCKSAASLKMELAKQLGTVLQGEIKPMITQCCIHELYLLGKDFQPAVDLAKTFERRMCNHKEPIPGDECVAWLIGNANKHRYVIASQSQPLRVKLRSVPAVPIVHVNRAVMVLEPPSDVTVQTKARMEGKSLNPSATDVAHVLSTAPATVETPKKKKKGPKGPNPLSVKKKKPTNDVDSKPSKSDKGKQKEMSGQQMANEVPDNAQAGEKRKRDDAHEDDNQSIQPIVVDIVENTGEGAGGHKRKRRRKGATKQAVKAEATPTVDIPK